MTAHVRGGSRSAYSNLVIGATTVRLAIALYAGGVGMPQYPAALQATLLAIIGVFHRKLSLPSWRGG